MAQNKVQYVFYVNDGSKICGKGRSVPLDNLNDVDELKEAIWLKSMPHFKEFHGIKGPEDLLLWKTPVESEAEIRKLFELEEALSKVFGDTPKKVSVTPSGAEKWDDAFVSMATLDGSFMRASVPQHSEVESYVVETKKKYGGMLINFSKTDLCVPSFSSHGAGARVVSRSLWSVVENEPCLLVHDLPTSMDKMKSSSKGLLELVEKKVGCLPIYAVSGAGKTRSCLEVLSLHHGLYLNPAPRHFMSQDVNMLMTKVKEKTRSVEGKSEKKSLRQENRLTALHMTKALLCSRLTILEFCLQVNPEFSPSKWLQLQLCWKSLSTARQSGEDVFTELMLILFHCDREEIDKRLLTLVSRVIKPSWTFPIFVDEAQIMGSFEEGEYISSLSDVGRSFLSPFLGAISLLKRTVLPCGTGLSLMRLEDYWESAGVPKGPIVPTVIAFTEYQGWKDEEEMKEYVSSILDVDASVLEEWYWFFAGRYRPIVTLVEYVLCGVDPRVAGQRLWSRITEQLRENLAAKFSLEDCLYSRLCQLSRRADKESKELLDLLKGVCVNYFLTGSPYIFSKPEQMKLVELGFAEVITLVDEDGVSTLWGSLHEKYAMWALRNFFAESGPEEVVRMACLQMTIFPDHVTAGYLWEILCMESLLSTFDGTCSIPDLPWFKGQVIPEDFHKPAKIICKEGFDYRTQNIGVIGQRSRKNYTFHDFLMADKGSRPVFFFPDTLAGPDIVFFLGHILVLLQVKLRMHVHKEANALHTTDPKKIYVFKSGKKKGVKRKERSEDFEAALTNACQYGVIRLLVGFPATLAESVHIRQREMTVSLGASNVGTLISEERLTFLQDLKKSMGSFSVHGAYDWIPTQ